MIDFEKMRFTHAVQSMIAKNPEWAADTIQAISNGVNDAVEQWKTDMSKMACLMLYQHLENNGKYQITEKDRLRIIDYLSRYFKMDNQKK